MEKHITEDEGRFWLVFGDDNKKHYIFVMYGSSDQYAVENMDTSYLDDLSYDGFCRYYAGYAEPRWSSRSFDHDAQKEHQEKIEREMSKIHWGNPPW